jgi:hypothetical protein
VGWGGVGWGGVGWGGVGAGGVGAGGVEYPFFLGYRGGYAKGCRTRCGPVESLHWHLLLSAHSD